ncbi:hypothetical protein SHL15_1016 [Streptomyces hygroscopicus subsp. limoneus]|nr:hypothetical protein SHL15_1016 [Streptomyces hygroscopicus subsp. limoneus]
MPAREPVEGTAGIERFLGVGFHGPTRTDGGGEHHRGLADTADPRVEPAHRGRGRGRQRRLFGRAAGWLWLCGTGRVPAREPVEGTAGIERFLGVGFHGPTRTDGGGEHHRGLADTADPRVEPAHRGRGRQRRLFGRAAGWLWLCGTGRVPAREPVEGTAGIERFLGVGFHGPTRTDGGGEHHRGLADTADPRVEPAHRGRGRQRRLFGRAAGWLWLCGTGRVPAREPVEGTAGIERFLGVGFHGPTRTDGGGEHHRGLADTADPRVEPAHRGRGRQRRLFGRAAGWLWLCGTGRVPAREPVEGTAGIERFLGVGFHEPTRTDGGGEHHPHRPDPPRTRRSS